MRRTNVLSLFRRCALMNCLPCIRDPRNAFRGFSLLLAAGVFAGCGSPNKANIELRKEKQQLEARIEALNTQHEAAVAQLRAYEQRTGTLETLPQERLEHLFTVHGIELGSLTGGADTDLKSPGDEGLKVYLIPRDETGAALKATGHLTVELFDLSRESENRIGRWEFEPGRLKDAWRSFMTIDGFVLTVPWQTPPERPSLAVKASFQDALTGRTFEALKNIQVNPPGSAPVTQPQQVTSP